MPTNDVDMLDVTGDIVADTLARLTGRDIARPRIKAFIRAAAVASKLFQQVQRSTFFGMTFEGATGDQRDAWGKILGEIRGGLDETRYRFFQELRIYVSTVDATVPRAIALLELALPQRGVAAFKNEPNGATFIVTGGALVSDSERSHLAGLFRDYQPMTHLYVVGEFLPTYFQFDLTGDELEGRPLQELIFGGT